MMSIQNITYNLNDLFDDTSASRASPSHPLDNWTNYFHNLELFNYISRCLA